MVMCKNIWIISISILLIGCTTNTKQYDIVWNTFSGINVNDIKLSLMFSNSPQGQQQKKYKLKPNVTKKIEVSKNFKFRAYEQTLNVHVVYNPELQMLPDGGVVEVYLFIPEVTRNSELQYTITSDDNAFAYFVKFSFDGNNYYVISKDNVLNIDLSNIKTRKKISEILEECSQNDCTYFLSTSSENDNRPEYWGGYIVKSKNYGNFIWLDPAN